MIPSEAQRTPPSGRTMSCLSVAGGAVSAAAVAPSSLARWLASLPEGAAAFVDGLEIRPGSLTDREARAVSAAAATAAAGASPDPASHPLAGAVARAFSAMSLALPPLFAEAAR